MPFSLEDQLRLLGPDLFEEVSGQLLKLDFEELRRMGARGGDEGIDHYLGDLEQVRRQAKGGSLRVWQCKFFRQGIKHTQKKNIEESLDRVVAKHRPEHWTLCVPIDLNPEERRWLETLKTRHPDITIDTWEAADQVSRLQRDDSQHLLDSYFIRHQLPLPHKLLEDILYRLEDFSPVENEVAMARQILAPGKQSAEDFYNGQIPRWIDIEQGYDAYREKFGEVWQFVANRANIPGGLVPLVLITGRSGDGKSTLIMRLAMELVQAGQQLVFFHKGDSNTLKADQFLGLPAGTPAFLFIDRLTRFDADNLWGFIERLHRLSLPVIVVGAAIRSLWEGLGLNLANVAEVREFGLEEMTDGDIEALLEKLEADPAYLGELARLSAEERFARFREKANRQLLVALLEAKRNQKFDTYIQRELDQLAERFKPYGVVVRRACRYVSAFHRFDLPIPRLLLQKLVRPEVHIDDDILHCTKGLLTEVRARGENIITRHACVAEVIFNLAGNWQRRYEEIIQAADPEHEPLMGRLIHTMTLGADRSLAMTIFPLICKKFPANVYFFHMQAMFCWREGNFSEARRIFRCASEIDPNNAPVWQAWALLEQEQHNIGDWPNPQEYSARWLFQKGVAADPQNAHSWQAWALLEEEQHNIGDWPNPQEYSARWLFQKGVAADPQNAHSWQAWALLEQEQHNIGDWPNPQEYSARWLFQKGVAAAPKHAPVWQAWALLEQKQHNIGDWPNPQEYSARWLFQKGVAADPQNAPLWQAWALLEQEQHNIGDWPNPQEYSARWLFQKGVAAAPKHAPVWQAWALLEQKQHNIGDWPNPQEYSARWLFQKGVAADPQDAPLWQAWALLEKQSKRFGDRDSPEEFTSRWLFRHAVDIEPNNAPSWQSWASLEAWRGNLGDPDHPEKFTSRWLFARAAEVDPEDPLSFTEWAKLERKEGYSARAEALWLKAASVEPHKAFRGRIFFDLAVMFSRLLGENPRNKVIIYLERAIAENPLDAKTHAYLGQQYGYRKQWEKSEHHFRESLRLVPDDLKTQRAYNNMRKAWAQWQQRQSPGGR